MAAIERHIEDGKRRISLLKDLVRADDKNAAASRQLLSEMERTLTNLEEIWRANVSRPKSRGGRSGG